jgi:prepilin-type N-terminal cleavage/methylation domain-containing protein
LLKQQVAMRGFTVVELIIVLALLAILSVLALPAFD